MKIINEITLKYQIGRTISATKVKLYNNRITEISLQNNKICYNYLKWNSHTAEPVSRRHPRLLLFTKNTGV